MLWLKVRASVAPAPEYTPSVRALVHHAGVQRDAVFPRSQCVTAVRFGDLFHAGDAVGSRPQFRGQGDFISDFKRVNFAEDSVGAPVVARQTDVAVPDTGVRKVTRSLLHGRGSGSLVDLDVDPDRGDFQGSQMPAAVVQVIGHVREADAVEAGVVAVRLIGPCEGIHAEILDTAASNYIEEIEISY